MGRPINYSDMDEELIISGIEYVRKDIHVKAVCAALKEGEQGLLDNKVSEKSEEP